MTDPTERVTDPEPRQRPYAVRLEWGPTGGTAVTEGAEVAVVVDVLSFTTTLTVAVERGIDVLPFRWRDDRAAAYAAEHDATLAVGRSEAAADPGSGRGAVTLSPASLAGAEGVGRLVLPSPNGSTISFGLADSGATVVGASLRNRSAVARWLRPRLDEGAVVALVPAGERWPDGSLRPAAEDLWGAGAVLAALDLDDDDDRVSPEAHLGRAAWASVAPRVGRSLADCAGGRELAAAGYVEDVRIAADVDAATVVPVLDGAVFTSG